MIIVVVHNQKFLLTWTHKEQDHRIGSLMSVMYGRSSGNHVPMMIITIIINVMHQLWESECVCDDNRFWWRGHLEHYSQVQVCVFVHTSIDVTGYCTPYYSCKWTVPNRVTTMVCLLQLAMVPGVGQSTILEQRERKRQRQQV